MHRLLMRNLARRQTNLLCTMTDTDDISEALDTADIP
jgi:hypothetical protein